MAEKSPRTSWDPPKMTFEEYDQKYPLAFTRVSEIIHGILPEARLEHVGSTSIPGLGGRRVLDIVIISRPEDQSRIREKLLANGFKDFPYAYIKPMLTGSAQYAGKEYPLLLYLLPEEHEYVVGWLRFRGYMRNHPEEVKRYAEVKRNAINAGKTDPRSYQESKTPYLEEVWKKASTD